MEAEVESAPGREPRPSCVSGGDRNHSATQTLIVCLGLLPVAALRP
jgi:hypothetical protein